MPAAWPGHATPSNGRQIAVPQIRDRAIGDTRNEQLDAQTSLTRCPGCPGAETDGLVSPRFCPDEGLVEKTRWRRQPGIGTAIVPHHGRKSERLTRAWYAGDSRRFPEGWSRCLNFVWREAMAGEGVEVLSWLTGNFESPTSPPSLFFSMVREPNQTARLQRARTSRAQEGGRGWGGGGSLRSAVRGDRVAGGGVLGAEPRMFAVPQTVHSEESERQIENRLPLINPTNGRLVWGPTSLRERAKGGRHQGWKGRGASGATLAHGLALRTLHRPAEAL